MMQVKHALVCAALGALLGCGGSAAKSSDTAHEAHETHEAAREGAARKGGRGLSMQGELGEISQADAERAFSAIEPQLLQCHQRGLAKHEYLAGDFAFLVRIGEDGKVRYVVLEHSDLGDRATEQCMIQAIQAARWPLPEGGEAEARKSFGFSEGDARPPFAWPSDKASEAIDAARGDLARCELGAKVQITAYVEPAGKGGKVVAIGGASRNAEAFERIDCALDALKRQAFPSPGSYAAKVSFEL